MSKAKEISDYLRKSFVITPADSKFLMGITSPATVQLFIALSLPVRRAIQTQLEVLEGLLAVQKTYFLLSLNKYDVISQQIEAIVPLLDELLAPLDRFFKIFPVDTILRESPEVASFVDEMKQSASDLMTDLVGPNPIKIPQWLIDAFKDLGVDPGEIFSNVNSYQDLRNKVNDLIYKLARSTSLKSRASNGIAYIENQLKKIEIYKTIIQLVAV